MQQQHGFCRTTCGCESCRVPCRHLPGSLDVEDLARLCPANEDVFTWAADHLRVLPDKSFPTLVPARQANGHCHWLYDGQCAVHENAPYSCAFFDSHQSAAEVERRSAATIAARRADAVQNGLYYRVWLYLFRHGLIGPPGDREALAAELHQIQSRV